MTTIQEDKESSVSALKTEEIEDKIIEIDEQITEDMNDYEIFEAMNLMNEIRKEGWL